MFQHMMEGVILNEDHMSDVICDQVHTQVSEINSRSL